MFASKTMYGAVGLSTYGASLEKQRKLTTTTCRATSMDMGRKSNNLYKVLSLESESVGPDEIKKAYRNMARRYHPDVCPPSRKEESTRMFVELHRAYETLSNPDLRRRYDIEIGMSEAGSAVRIEFERAIWEAQLNELRKQSDRRAKNGSRRA